MSAFTLQEGPDFGRQAKRLTKKYFSFRSDLRALVVSLTENPLQGVALGRGCYKIRLAISSKGKGKSGGARVITLVKVEAERVVLLTIFDKSDRENLLDGELDALLAEAGLTTGESS